MPKTIYIPEDASTSGINITWTKSTSCLSFGGWYDSIVSLEGSKFSLREFFDSLGITEIDCKKAWKKEIK